jgi:hypothetical protein
MLTESELATIAEIPLHGDVPRLVAEIRTLRTALAWYADEGNYDLEELYSEDPRLAAKGVTYRSYPVLEDEGERARAALDDRAPREG